MADTDGRILVGKLSPEEYAAGGVWPVGDRQLEGHPGRDLDLCYKSWVALPDRYAPGRKPLIDRAEAGWVEYVQVFTGRLDLLLEQNGGRLRTTLEYPQDTWIQPAQRRTWELPDSCMVATGATILMKMSPEPRESSGQIFSCWDDKTSLPLFMNHSKFPGWSRQYVEVFMGGVRWKSLLGGAICVILEPLQHIFLLREAEGTWEILETPTRGISIFL